MLICAPNHILSTKDEVEVKDIGTTKFIGFEPDIPTRRAIDKIFRDAGFDPKPVMEFDNIETVKRAVEIDAGISIVPRATIEQEVRGGSLVAIEFKGRPYHRPLSMILQERPGAFARAEAVPQNTQGRGQPPEASHAGRITRDEPPVTSPATVPPPILRA